MSTGVRPVAQIAVVLLVVVPVGCGGSGGGGATESTTTETETTTETAPPTTTETEPGGPTVVRIDVVNGAPSGGIVRATVDEGDRVEVVVTSDVADEVHLHGYDVSGKVAAGGTVRLGFRATIPGRFEAELEERGVPIGELSVQP